MKKILVALVAVGLSVVGANAQLVQWNTVGNLGTETTEASAFNNVNVGASTLTLGSTVAAAANGGRFGGSGWFDTGMTVAGSTLAEAITANSFIEFTLTPNVGFQYTATSFSFYWDRSNTGPSSVALRSSADSFGSNLGSVTGLTSGGTFSLNTITIGSLTNVSTATTFRLYGFGATATGGTAGFDTQASPVDLTLAPNVSLNGTTSVIPEPSTYALLALGLGALVLLRRKSAKKV